MERRSTEGDARRVIAMGHVMPHRQRCKVPEPVLLRILGDLYSPSVSRD